MIKFAYFSVYQILGQRAWFGVKIEMALLVCVTINTVILSVLLVQTRKHLSTATILFIFNILFSNSLFVASFVCLFSDLFTDLPFISPEEVRKKEESFIIINNIISDELLYGCPFRHC